MKPILHGVVALFLASQTSTFGQVFSFSGSKSFDFLGYVSSGGYSGSLAIDSGTGSASLSGSGSLSSSSWSISRTTVQSVSVLLDPGQPAHFPFPAIPPTFGTQTFTDNLSMHFVTGAVTYALSAPSSLPVSQGGNIFALPGNSPAFLIPVNYDYTITENGTIISSGVGTYNIGGFIGNTFRLDVTSYPASVGLSFVSSLNRSAGADSANDRLSFSAPHASWQIAVVPEPAAYALVGSTGLVVFGLVARRRDLGRVE